VGGGDGADGAGGRAAIAAFFATGRPADTGSVYSPRHRGADVPAHIDSFAGRQGAARPRL